MTKMHKLLKNNTFLSILIVLLAFFFAEGGCSGGNDGDKASSDSDTAGTLSLSLTDSSIDLQAVYVTINNVKVHMKDDSWKSVMTSPGTYDLLELRNGVLKSLGNSTLSPGDYTQMRLVIGTEPENSTQHEFANYVVDNSNATQKLKVPSGTETGIKLVNGFTIAENQTTELILDFDASKSIHKAGKSGKWILRPTIDVLSKTTLAKVQGQVSSTNESNMKNAVVSLQTVNSSTATYTYKEIIVHSSTLAEHNSTTGNSTYTLLFDPGQYNLVASKTGFETRYHSIDADKGELLEKDFSLPNSTTGLINGTVEVKDNLEDDRFAALSFRRQDVNPMNSSLSTVKAEIKNIKVSDSNSTDSFGFTFEYNASLTNGEYEVVAAITNSTTFFDESERLSSTGSTEDFILSF